MIAYNKTYTKKDGRTLIASGPRDLQRRQQLDNNPAQSSVVDSDEVKSLRKDLEEITSTIKAKTSDYTKEQVDEMINSAIEEVTIELEEKYISKINKLKNYLSRNKEELSELKTFNKSLNEKLDKKDDVIIDLTSKLSAPQVIMSSDGGYTPEDDARPSMDNIYIDPIAKGAGDKMESHLTVKEEVSSKPAVIANVDKLKKLMGNLPK